MSARCQKERTDSPGMLQIYLRDPAAPMYQWLPCAHLSHCATHDPVGAAGYIGQDRPTSTANLPPSGVDLLPNIVVAAYVFIRD